MPEMKPTPKPWHVEFTTDGPYIVAEDGSVIASCRWQTMPEADANAVQMAASPELLEACELVLSQPHKAFCDDYYGQPCNCHYAAARAAIAKARGVAA